MKTATKRCLSCNAVLIDDRTFCDPECEKYARENGFRTYTTPKYGKFGRNKHGNNRKKW